MPCNIPVRKIWIHTFTIILSEYDIKRGPSIWVLRVFLKSIQTTVKLFDRTAWGKEYELKLKMN